MAAIPAVLYALPVVAQNTPQNSSLQPLVFKLHLSHEASDHCLYRLRKRHTLRAHKGLSHSDALLDREAVLIDSDDMSR